MNQQALSGAMQENVLTLLCFDDDHALQVRSTITPSLFESAVFREIASQACDFLDQFKQAIKEHLPDTLEHILKGTDRRKATSYQRVLDNLYLARDTVNAQYVVSQLHAFVRQQTIKSAIVKAVEAVEDGNVSQAEVELQRGLTAQFTSFEPGIAFADPKQSLAFFDHVGDAIPLGIGPLDRVGIGPAPGEMLMFIAPPKRGKSWALTHVGKMSILHRKRVLHITLEMSEARVSQRYIQSFFAVGKRETRVRIPKFELDSLGRLVDIDHEEVTRPTLQDPGIRAHLANRLRHEFKRRPPLMIKQFPTGTLTLSQLNAYLDQLERFHKFIPDVLVLDYPDLMKLGSDNVRVDTGNIYKGLRGIAVERNCALAVASQGNRTSSRAEIVTDDMVAEDYSKIATADNVITYNQTEAEKALGLARLFVSNGRNDEDKFVTLISQSYPTGQFCLDSTLLLSDYWQQIERAAPQQERKPRARRRPQDDEE